MADVLVSRTSGVRHYRRNKAFTLCGRLWRHLADDEALHICAKCSDIRRRDRNTLDRYRTTGNYA